MTIIHQSDAEAHTTLTKIVACDLHNVFIDGVEKGFIDVNGVCYDKNFGGDIPIIRYAILNKAANIIHYYQREGIYNKLHPSNRREILKSFSNTDLDKTLEVFVPVQVGHEDPKSLEKHRLLRGQNKRNTCLDKGGSPNPKTSPEP
ncbi:MAG: hypothetical protein WC464_01610 [Bdellovibrionales bacterium]